MLSRFLLFILMKMLLKYFILGYLDDHADVLHVSGVSVICNGFY
jgi:hypothetical protein